MIKIFLFCLLSYQALIFSSQSWYEGRFEGWYYFEDLEGRSGKQVSITPEEADFIIHADRKKLEQLLSLALVDPSPENVTTYLSAQKRWLDQSALFANAWGKAILQNPLAGEFFYHPTTSYGILAKKENDLNRRKSLLKNLSKDHFLLFFFQGNDVFSQRVAEVVQLFSQVNQWTVKAVSLDGKGIHEFPDFETDKGISVAMGVKASPSLFIVNPLEETAFPVGAGLVTVSDIEENIELQVGGIQ